MLSQIVLAPAAGLVVALVSDPRRPAFVFGPYLLRAAVDAVLALVRVPAVALGSLGGYGVGTSTGAVTFNSLLQAETPPAARGRVFAAFNLIWQAGRLASRHWRPARGRRGHHRRLRRRCRPAGRRRAHRPRRPGRPLPPRGGQFIVKWRPWPVLRRAQRPAVRDHHPALRRRLARSARVASGPLALHDSDMRVSAK